MASARRHRHARERYDAQSQPPTVEPAERPLADRARFAARAYLDAAARNLDEETGSRCRSPVILAAVADSMHTWILRCGQVDRVRGGGSVERETWASAWRHAGRDELRRRLQPPRA